MSADSAPKSAPAPEVKDANADSRLYVSNLKWELSDEDLKTLFAEHGKVVEARIVRDKRSGWSRGYGFVTYENKDDATKAVTALNDKEIHGRQIRVENARSSGPTQPSADGAAAPAAGDAGAPSERRRARGRGRGRGRGRRGGRGGRGRGRRARGDGAAAGDAAPAATPAQ